MNVFDQAINKISRSLRRRLYSKKLVRLDQFLNKSKGVVHVGANRGQEADFYAEKDLYVLWIEPIPMLFEKLMNRIANYPKQHAVCALITNCDDQTYKFNLADNNGASSSILTFKGHESLYPTIRYIDVIELVGITLDTLIQRNEIDSSLYDSLIIDTQGAELMVLQGALNTLKNIRYVKLEVSDFESYSGGSSLIAINNFFANHKFKKVGQVKTDGLSKIGFYYEVLFRNEMN